MGGPSSFYAMLAISGFLTAVWMSGKISGLIGVSSIVLEVAVGLVLGPQVLKMIPSELSECFSAQEVSCDRYKYQLKIAKKGYKYCDLGAYIQDGAYVPSTATWDAGFFGTGYPTSNGYVTLPGVDGEMGGTYCLHATSRGCQSAVEAANRSDRSGRRLNEGSPEAVSEMVPAAARQLAGDKEGKTDYDSYEKCIKESCKLDVNTKCAYTPDIFTLVGHTGVAMMIFESGLHFDFEQAKTVGPWACAVAVLGTFLPLISGAALSLAYGFDFFPDALSAGTALAPTSVGIALKLLHEARALQTYFGQAVMTAAFVDDVLSLILFSVIFSAGDDMDFLSFLPLILGCVFMVVAIIAAVKVWPPVITWLFQKIPEYKPGAKVTTHDEVMWFLMFFTLAAYAQITHLCGTHLWGCFIAGMSFATQHHAHHVWVKQVKRLTCWFLRIFFACTLAWSIPVDELFSLEAFWKGSLMGIGPCILTKVLCGPFMGSSRWVIGWAMVGRAEFAYFIAILAKSTDKMDEKLFAILVWSLLYATIFAPLIFRKVLQRYMMALELAEAEEDASKSEDTGKTSQTKKTSHLSVSSSLHSSSSMKSMEERAVDELDIDLEFVENCGSMQLQALAVEHGLSSAAAMRRMVKRNLNEGHLPDFEAEKIAQEETKLKMQNFKLQVQSEQKDSRIKELKADIERLKGQLDQEARGEKQGNPDIIDIDIPTFGSTLIVDCGEEEDTVLSI